jgi:uncharacterized protein YcfJ
MKKIITTTMLGFITLSSGAAFAGQRYNADRDVYFDQAKVIQVEPIYTTVRISIPQEECYQEEVRTPVYNNHSNGTAVVGGVIGGLVGHQLGRGKKGATIAGTILGAAIGKNAGREGDRYSEHVSYQDRCSTHVSYRMEERIDGYNVTYRYQGEIFTTRMDQHPGKQLRVRVQVSPVVY